LHLKIASTATLTLEKLSFRGKKRVKAGQKTLKEQLIL
jgi:hypothetical protein